MLHASFLIFPLYESIRVDPPSPPGHKIRFAVLDAVSSLLQLWCWTMGLRSLHPNGPDCMMCISFPLSASFPHSWVYFPPAFSAPVTSHLNNSTIFLLYGIICWYVSHGTNSHLMSRACSPDSILYLFVPAVLAMQGTTGRFISLKKTKTSEVKLLIVKWFGTQGLSSMYIALVKSWWLKCGPLMWPWRKHELTHVCS